MTNPHTLVGWLGSVASAQANRPAMFDGSQEISYREMWSRAGGIAAHLLADPKIPVGSRIGLIGANEPAFVEAFLGVIRAGHVVVPLNSMLDTESILSQLAMVEASAVIIGDVTVDIAEAIEATGHSLRLKTLWNESTPAFHDARLPELLPDSPALIVPTSGSTGLPKGVLHTESSLLHCALQIASATPMRPDDRNVCFLPFFAAIPEQVLPSLCSGGSIDVLPRFDIERVADACRRATCFDTIPTLMARLMDEAPIDALANLRWVYFASEPMPPAVLRRWHETLPNVEAHQFYGMTELVPATYAPHWMMKQDNETVGVAFPTTFVGQDESTGELLISSPAQMRGYYNNVDATAGALTMSGAIKTGDLGRIDERGRVYLTGRLKDIIISGGLNVAPAEIEAFACHHPSVGAAAVVGIPDSRWGETPVVIGVAREGETLTPALLLDYCRTGLKGFKRPSAAAVVEELPSTGIGKISKNVLRDQIVNGELSIVRAD